MTAALALVRDIAGVAGVAAETYCLGDMVLPCRVEMVLPLGVEMGLLGGCEAGRLAGAERGLLWGGDAVGSSSEEMA